MRSISDRDRRTPDVTMAGSLDPSGKSQSVLALLLMACSLSLPVLLIYSALNSYRAVGSIRDLYLKNRVAAIKGQLEIMPALSPRSLRTLLGAEQDLADIRVFRRPLPTDHSDADSANPIFAGETGPPNTETGSLYRSYVSIHRPNIDGERYVARIDIESEAGDGLISDAVLHLTIAYLAALGSLGTLAAYLVVVRRSGHLRHLAQLGTMSAALAHEIRNPLGTIKGFAQLTRKKAGADVARVQDLILSEVRRLEKLVEDLLSFARPREPLMRATSWDQVVSLLRGSVAEDTVRVVFDGPLHLTLLTDPDLVVEILLNLIRNAAEASDQGSVVLVSASLRDGTAVICVDDEGCGIPARVRRQMFEPFFSTKATGTGLGLPISQRVAAKLRGTLRVAPRSPRGTRARLELPEAHLPAGSSDEG